MTNEHYSELIEKYLAGEMTGEQASQFEQMLEQDPMLSSEFNFQQQIVDGIKDYRKTELKMRLDNVDITPGLFESIATNSFVQTTAGVILTGVVTVGSYWWLTEPQRVESVAFDIQSKTSELTTHEFLDNIPGKLPLLELQSIEPSIYPKEEVKEEITLEQPGEKTEKIGLPTIVQPQLAEEGKHENFSPEIEEIEPLRPEKDREVNQIEVENIATTRPDFQYKFYNNKLFLYGDFKGIPYEILEINNKSGKKLFLFYNDLYYRINNDVTKTSRLEEVTNNDQIRELNILRENKTVE